eukprot:TRINITY_DN1849_c0_g1_i1.p1 TRINITY_DN1849_c0_g1~~TRINITY_DN1849_c0_g1_i1.p1  ORF type:complete len:769 (+),score=190.37 TRINITY_DN1849_c0_g1_i1:110-2416(+)
MSHTEAIEAQRKRVQQEQEYLQRLEALAIKEKELAEREAAIQKDRKRTSSSSSQMQVEASKGAAPASTAPGSVSSTPEASSPRFKYLNATDGTRVIHDDPWLEPCAQALRDRYSRYLYKKKMIEDNEGGLDKFSQGYKKMGFNRTEGGIMYREWAPNARQAFLMGDFNGWDRRSHEMKKDEYGVFSLFLPDQNGKPAISHKTKVKIAMFTMAGEWIERIPAWIKVVWQEKGNVHFDGVYWEPEEPYRWRTTSPKTPQDLRIYECHIGMSSQEAKINTYIEFSRDLLPYIKEMGYNAIQIMAIMEHAYYASFGYQVSSFFAVSSRFGTPDELKELVDHAHELGIIVLLDIVHSHASKNVDDGINRFDGTDHQYFHEGGKGNHPIWDSRLFNYGHWEVLRFLLSNARWFIEEYHFDGFRFDGVTSMIYTHHGVAHSFDRGYDEYFNSDLVDNDAITYLTLVNDMLHNLRDSDHRIVTISEEVSGMATMCRPIQEGGMGFDFRLAMGIPDRWIELVSKIPDEDWDMQNLVYTLTNRRYLENTIAYCESHDQALVGDKTLAFWLMDKEMYFNMSVLQPINHIVDRGMALHKMIRLVTCGLGGEGYLTFMGNEFGHPEWIDFPRAGNNDSYHYARRRWDLPKDHLLRYQFLSNFEKRMNQLEDVYKWLSSPQAYVTLKHDGDKVIAFERGNLFWVFNFHSNQSYTDYAIGISHPGKYKIVLNSDTEEFGGHNRITKFDEYFSQPEEQHGMKHRLMVYIPCRTALVFALDGPKK